MATDDNLPEMRLIRGGTPTETRFGRLRRAVEIGEKIASKSKTVLSKHERKTHRLMTAGEVVVGAAAGGLIQGKAGDHKLLGTVPYDLAAGGAALIVSIFGERHIGEKTGEHLLNLGTGLVSAWVSGETFKIGQKWRENGTLFGKGDAHPGLPPTGTSTAGIPGPARMASILHGINTANHH
jgi:hypothetical protein